MKIELTEHERQIIITALMETKTVIGRTLANKLYMQDPTGDGPEVVILNRKTYGRV